MHLITMKLAQKLAINFIRARLNFTAVFSKRKAAEQAFVIFSTPFRKQRKTAPKIFESAELIRFQLEKDRIVGYRWNKGGDRKILIVHGFESNSRNFDRYISSFVKRGFEVLAFDAPAHGLSSGKSIILPTYISLLKRIDEDFGPIDGYLSHSFGGLALSLYLETNPDNHKVRAVLIAPATETTSTIDSFFKFLHLDQGVRIEFDRYIEERGGVPASHYSIRRAIRNISGKILWFHDEDDDLTPVSDALLAKSDDHPHVQFVITSGLGHRRIYRENKVVKDAIEFLCEGKPTASQK